MTGFIAADWPAPANIRAGTTTRQGGNSQQPYASFNLATHVNDKPEDVQKNRLLLQDKLALPTEPIWLQQCHSCCVLEATSEHREAAADASWSRTPKQICAILTADCLPILICDKKGSGIAAIHAGWRGLANGIIETTLEVLKFPPAETLVWLGPAISQRAFEVGHDVVEAFTSHDPQAIDGFVATSKEKWLADLYHLARMRLHTHHITQIYGGNYCTYTQTDQFFSYRRSSDTGRMASLIWMDGAAE